jgi:hypothetical protein
MVTHYQHKVLLDGSQRFVVPEHQQSMATQLAPWGAVGATIVRVQPAG